MSSSPDRPADSAERPRFLAVGRIHSAHGIRGEVRVQVLAQDASRFQELEQLFLGEADPRPVALEGARPHKSGVLLKLRGVDDRNAAEALRGQLLQVAWEDAVPLEDGEYYLYQLLGLQAYSDAGEHLGELVYVLETGANNVFVIKTAGAELLLPDIPEVIQAIDFAAGRMVVHLLPGLVEGS
ncbi:MAG: ribosome maturation factor RimM [Candidatus Promineifilaceae bacterium]